MVRSVVNASLQYTTSMPVCSNFYAIRCHSIVNKLGIGLVLIRNHDLGDIYLIVFGCKFVETFLDYVVTIEVLDQNNHMQAESYNDGVYLKHQNDGPTCQTRHGTNLSTSG